MEAGILKSLIFRPRTLSIIPRRARHHHRNNGVFFSPHNFKSFPPMLIRAAEMSGQINSDGNNYEKAADTLDITKALLRFTETNFIPIALVSGVTLGMTFPKLGCVAHKYSLSKFSTFGIFLLSGLKLKGGEFGAVAKVWPAVIFGLVSIMGLSPILSRLILGLQLEPQELIKGLAIFCCVPAALSSGVALTQLAAGNSALALTMTVASNLLGILVVPFWISKFLAKGLGVVVPTEQLIWGLVLTLLLPLIFGKALRSVFQGLAASVDNNGKTLSIMSTILLCLTPWMQVSKSRPFLLMVKPVVFLEAVGMGIAVHLTLLVLNAIIVKVLSCSSSVFAKKENARALLVVCSQKSLTIAVAVVDQLGGLLGESGLLLLPCVAAQITQIIIDSFLVNFWVNEDQSLSTMKSS